MKIKITDKKEQPLLYRQEIRLSLEFESSVPERSFLQEQVAKAAKADKKLVVIDKIMPKFGFKHADVLAYVYADEKKLNSFVRAHMKKRHEVKKEEKKEGEKPSVKDKQAKEDKKEDGKKTEEAK